MKYLEEISSGECCQYKNKQYLVTHDFKKNGSRLCYCLTDGIGVWLEANTIVESFVIYGLDNDNNVYPLKIATNHENNI
jgi:hypothetical protein